MSEIMRPESAHRQVYRSGHGSRWFGIVATSLVYVVILLIFSLAFQRGVRSQPPSVPTIVHLSPLVSPPAPPADQQKPAPHDPKVSQPETQKRELAVPPAPITPALTPTTASAAKPVDPPKQPDAAPPKAMPAPAAPQATSNAPDSWEGHVLAQLNRHRRYPVMAQARRQQGVPYIRFVMDRRGRVLSVQLERSSGFAELDREAVALPKRAQPLPAAPDDKPGETLELVVPVEFLLK